MNQGTSKPSGEAPIEALIDALRNELPRDLDDHEIAALLGWIANSSRNPGAQILSDALGPSGDNEALTGHAFSLLDESLFDGEYLLTELAGVGDEREHDARRRRYRLLLSAFHPDRYPARADWLTSRSQVITRAYARFKAGQTAEMPHVETPPPATRRRPTQYRGITPNWRLAERLRSRWGQDRFLAHKIIGVLALFLLLPVVSILLDQQTQSPVDTERAPEPRINLDALDLKVGQWPLQALTAPWLEADQNALAATESAASGPDSLWASIQDVATAGVPEWLERARVGSSSPATDSPGSLMLAFLEETGKQMDTLAQSIGAVSSLPEPRQRIPDPVIVPPQRPAPAPQPETAAPTRQSATTSSIRPSQPSRDYPRKQQSQNNQQKHDSEADNELPRGRINLGPLSNHQVGELLSDYRSSIESGDLEGVLDVLGREPRDNNRIGRDGFEQHYRELFNASSQRSLSLQILNATRQGNGWRVAAQYQLDLRDTDSGQDDRVERDVEFVILPDPFRLKIVAVEY